jgi:hypothetical protein
VKCGFTAEDEVHVKCPIFFQSSNGVLKEGCPSVLNWSAASAACKV